MEKTINSGKILYSKGGNDECYTPRYGVLPIINYIKVEKERELHFEKGKRIYRDVKNTIRCPFDKENSQFVICLKEKGFNVICSHIDNGQDFFKYEPEKRDIIISNPPFTNKRKIFERALSFNKPFALLMSNTRLNDSAPKQLFEDKDLQLLMFDKRIEFNGNKKITFSSSYYCYDVLPKQIIMCFISKE